VALPRGLTSGSAANPVGEGPRAAPCANGGCAGRRTSAHFFLRSGGLPA